MQRAVVTSRRQRVRQPHAAARAALAGCAGHHRRRRRPAGLARSACASTTRDAIARFRDAGQIVEDDVVRFDPPSCASSWRWRRRSSRMRARNPARDLVIGGDHMVFGPAQGPPFVRMGDERRDGTMADLEALLKLTQLTDAMDTAGRNILEPNDLPLDVRHLLRASPSSASPIACGPASRRATSRRRTACASPRSSSAAARRSRRRPSSSPTATSTRRCSSTAACSRASSTYAAAGQAVIITPFLLMGAMAPVSVPAALVQQTVEVLAGVALVQLIRPGHAVRDGLVPLQHRHEDGLAGLRRPGVGVRPLRVRARSRGASACPGARGGGTLTASPAVDYQAGYEAMNTLQAAFLAGANVCWQSAGWLEGGLVTCFEKFVGRLRAARPAAAPVHAGRDRRGEPRLRRPRRGAPRRPLLRRRAHAGALPRLLLAADRGHDGEQRPLDEAAARSTTRRARAGAGASCWRRTSARRSTRRSRRSWSSSSSAGRSSSATR